MKLITFPCTHNCPILEAILVLTSHHLVSLRPQVCASLAVNVNFPWNWHVCCEVDFPVPSLIRSITLLVNSESLLVATQPEEFLAADVL